MAAEKVEYEINLRDLLSPKIHDAEKATKSFEGSVGSLNGAIAKIGGILAGAFAVSKIVDFAKESAEMYSQIEFAQSQLQAGLASTGGAAGVTFDGMVASAKNFAHELKFTQAQIEDTQSIFLTFPSITKDIFDRTTAAAMDMATRLKGDPKDAAMQLGKALQDPEKGIAALHRVGVNTDELKKKFETVTDTIERQKLILGELETEFGGSAKAAAEADAGFRRTKTIEEMKVALGSLTDKIEEALSPALEWLANVGLNAINKLQELWAYVEKTVDFSAVAENIKAFGQGVYNFFQPLFAPIVEMYKAVWNGLKKVWDALSQFSTEGPGLLQWFQDGLMVFIELLTWLYSKIFAFIAAIIDFAHTLWVLLEKLKVITVLSALFEGVWWAIKKIGDGIGWLYDHTIKPILDGIGWAYDKLKGMLGIKDVKVTAKNEVVVTEDKTMKDAKDLMPVTKSLLPSTPPTGSAAPTKAGKSEASKVTGQKSVNITISIDKLIEKFNISTVNMQEGAAKIQELVAQTLLGAVRDSQIKAGI